MAVPARTPPCRRAASLMRYSRAAAAAWRFASSTLPAGRLAQSARQGATHSPASPGKRRHHLLTRRWQSHPTVVAKLTRRTWDHEREVRLRDELFCDRRQDPAGDGGQLLRPQAIGRAAHAPARSLLREQLLKKISSRSVCLAGDLERDLGAPWPLPWPNARADPGPCIHGAGSNFSQQLQNCCTQFTPPWLARCVSLTPRMRSSGLPTPPSRYLRSRRSRPWQSGAH